MPMARAKSLDFEMQIHHEVPSKVMGDPGRLRQLLLNLATNAIKFTERGRVVVRVERLEEYEDTVSLRLAVDDAASEIAPETFQALRDSFEKEDIEAARRVGGPGLGLYVSRRLVNFMKGHVGIDVRPGGHSFWIRIPLTKQKEQAASGELAAVELNGLRVLVADPSATLRQSMGEILKAWGARVDEASTPETALEALRQAARG